MLLTHRWPLNIRALDKTLLTAATLASDGVIQPVHVVELLRRAPSHDGTHDETSWTGPPAPPVPFSLLRSPRDEALREQLAGLLSVHRGNVVAVARAMATRRTQIYRWAHRFGIDLAGFRR